LLWRKLIVDAKWQVIYNELGDCIKIAYWRHGGDAALCGSWWSLWAGRVVDADLRRVAKATTASIQTTTNACGTFEERQVGDGRFNLFTECPSTLTCTIVLRGGTEQFTAESEQSVHDALMVVKRAIQSGSVVACGGALV
jgi:T-complex protein 1 subunit eta